MVEPAKPQSVDSVSRRTRLPRNFVLAFARIDPMALGLALGLVTGFWLWLATVLVIVRAGGAMEPYLSLLAQYFIGFTVTPAGSLIAFGYGALGGFVLGYLFAALRNFVMFLYMVVLKRRAEKQITTDLLDRLT